MDRAIRRRFAILVALLVVLVLAGLVSLPFLEQCCPDPPLPSGWPEPPNRTVFDKLFFMDMVPRLAALAVAAGATSLAGVGGIYAVTGKSKGRDGEARALGYVGVLRALAAAFVVGVLYLYGFFVTGYLQLGWFNLVWIIGIPVLLAGLTGRDKFERRWGGLLLIIPGFLAVMGLMMALRIDPY